MNLISLSPQAYIPTRTDMLFTHFFILYALLVLKYLTGTTSGCYDSGIKIKDAVESEDLTDIFDNFCKQYVGRNISLNDKVRKLNSRVKSRVKSKHFAAS